MQKCENKKSFANYLCLFPAPAAMLLLCHIIIGTRAVQKHYVMLIFYTPMNNEYESDIIA